MHGQAASDCVFTVSLSCTSDLITQDQQIEWYNLRMLEDACSFLHESWQQAHNTKRLQSTVPSESTMTDCIMPSRTLSLWLHKCLLEISSLQQWREKWILLVFPHWRRTVYCWVLLKGKFKLIQEYFMCFCQLWMRTRQRSCWWKVCKVWFHIKFTVIAKSYFFAVQNTNVLIEASMVYVKPNLVFELVPDGL